MSLFIHEKGDAGMSVYLEESLELVAGKRKEQIA